MKLIRARQSSIGADFLQRVAILSLTYLAFVGCQQAFAGPVPALDANLQLWLDASDLNANGVSDNPSSGSAVSLWDDGSGSGNDAIQATPGFQPTYQSSGIGGKPVVRFVGGRGGPAQDLMDVTFSSTVAQPYSIFVVGRIDGDSVVGNAADYLIDGTLPGNRVALGINPSGTNEDEFFMYAGGANAPATTFTRSDWLDPHIYMGEFDSSARIFVDGANMSLTGGALGANSLTAIRIGNRFTADTGLNGDIAEILIYDKVLTDGERESVEAYLNAKYFVPEPSSLALFALGATLFIRRDRCQRKSLEST